MNRLGEGECNEPLCRRPRERDKRAGEFYYRSRCTTCRKRRRRLAAIIMLGAECNVCRETDADVLEIDHRHNDGHRHRNTNTEDQVITMAAELGKKALLAYWNLLCANCHKRRTHPDVYTDPSYILMKEEML